MSEAPRPDCAALLAHVDWVRALARHLTADSHSADDLAQEALAAAVARPPGEARSLRAWLAGVLRNLVRQERRAQGHRSARERAAARPEPTASSGELLERLDSHRAVVEAVTHLDEPYRTTILLRYFEELTPSAIARRTGTPLRTVHTRLQRALARLRSELDRAHGDRRTWLLALLPYARGSGGWSGAATGALMMETKLKLGVAALAVVGVCSTLALWRAGVGTAAPARRTAETLAPEARASAGEPVLAAAPEVAGRILERVSAERPAASDWPAPAAPARLVGRVLDVEQAPVSGLRVRFTARDGASAEARSDAAGAFALARPHSGGTLDVVDPGWTCLFRPAFEEAPGARELVLVVARSVTLAGRVLDEEGRGIEAASVAMPLPFRLRARFDAILDGAATVEPRATSGPDGRFELDAVPVGGELELVTTHPAYREDRRAPPPYDAFELEITLHRGQVGPRHVAGLVVDAAGEPVAGAWVAMGQGSTRSGPDGAFAFELTDEEARGQQVLRAVKPGHLPAELVRRPDEPGEEPLVLVLGPPPLALAGRVVNARGDPVPGAEVWTEEETHFGTVPIEGGEMSVRVGASIEGLLRDDPWTHRVRADGEGRFRLSGLLPRDYHLRAFDRVHLLLASHVAAAGEEAVELRLPEEELEPRVAGRVTDLGGEPLAEVEVQLERPALGGGPANQLEGQVARTDADGRFAFERVSRAVCAVRVEGPQLLLGGFHRTLSPGDDRARLELAVALRVHARIDAGEAAGYERAALLDERGTTLSLVLDHGQHSFVLDALELDRGHSESFSVSELATTLVLFAHGAEQRRVPIALVRGELNTLRP